MLDSTPVTVIGLGAMGSAMAERYLAAGRPTTVWNRSAAKADPLAAKGATVAATAAGAVAASGVIIVSQVDIPAMYDSLGATIDLSGKVVVNLSSDTPVRAREAADWVAGRGGEYVDAGIMVPAPMIGQPGAYTFYCGAKETVERVRPELEILGAVEYLGVDYGLSQLYYQALLMVFWAGQFAMFQSAVLVRVAGHEIRDLARFLKTSFALIGEFVEPMLAGIDTGDHPGAEANLRMQAVGMGHVLETMRAAGVDLTLPTAIKELFDRADSAGHGQHGLSSVAEIMKPRN